LTIFFIFPYFFIFFEFSRVYRVLGRVCTGFPGRVGTGPKRVGSRTIFFQFCLPTSVLDPPILTGHESDEFVHGSRWIGSRPRITRVGSDPPSLSGTIQKIEEIKSQKDTREKKNWGDKDVRLRIILTH
jgi:hypothetical protein